MPLFWRRGFQIERLALRWEAGCLCQFAWCGGGRLGKAGFWWEIEGGWKFSFEIQVETREKLGPLEN